MANLDLPQFDIGEKEEVRTYKLRTLTEELIRQFDSLDLTTATSGGGGTFSGVHNDTTFRSAADTHPISSITGLQAELDLKAGPADLLGKLDLDGGNGPVTGPLGINGLLTVSVGGVRVVDGTVASPSFAFTNETTTGLWSDPSYLGFTYLGVEKFHIDAAGADVTGTLDTTGALTVAAGGATVTGDILGNNLITAVDDFRGKNGTAGDPAYTFTSDVTTGMFWNASFLGFSFGGLEKFHIDAAGADVTGTLDTTGAITVASGNVTLTAGNVEVVAGQLNVDTVAGITESVTSIVIRESGSGYDGGDTVTLVLAPDGVGTAAIVDIDTVKVVSATLNAAGTGYAVNDLVTLNLGPGGAGTAAVMKVTGRHFLTGAITGFVISTFGAYTSAPSPATGITQASVSPPGGSGATFDLTAFEIDTISLNDGGSYTVITHPLTTDAGIGQASTSGSGSGITVDAVFSITDTVTVDNSSGVERFSINQDEGLFSRLGITFGHADQMRFGDGTGTTASPLAAITSSRDSGTDGVNDIGTEGAGFGRAYLSNVAVSNDQYLVSGTFNVTYGDEFTRGSQNFLGYGPGYSNLGTNTLDLGTQLGSFVIGGQSFVGSNAGNTTLVKCDGFSSFIMNPTCLNTTDAVTNPGTSEILATDVATLLINPYVSSGKTGGGTAGNARIQAAGTFTTIIANAFTTGTADCVVETLFGANGSFIQVYASALSSDIRVWTSAEGCFARGWIIGGSIHGGGRGAFVSAAVNGSGALADALGEASFNVSRVSGVGARSSSSGSAAMVVANVEGTGVAEALTDGSTAFGTTALGWSIRSITGKGNGSDGAALTGDIVASGSENCWQRAQGTNDEQNSWKIGEKGTGIWLRGLNGPFSVQHDGQMWTEVDESASTVVIYSNGTDVQIDNRYALMMS